MCSFQVKYKMLEELVKHSLLRADTGVRPYTLGHIVRAWHAVPLPLTFDLSPSSLLSP